NYIPFFTASPDPDYASGLDGGTVENVIVDPHDSNIIYAGTWGNAIYKSLDAGKTWFHLTEDLRSPYIYEIAIDPLNSDHLLASVYENGIDQSFDGGNTWSPVAGFDGYSVVYSIDFDSSIPLSDPVRSSTVYAAVRQETIILPTGNIYPGGVWKSTDGGDNWGEVTHTDNGFYQEDYIYDLAIDPNNPSTIYTANHRTGVYKTNNGGDTWFKTSNGLAHQDIRGIQVNPVNGIIYAGIWDGYGFAFSKDGGQNWTMVSSTRQAGLYVYEVQYDPYQPNNVYLTTSTGVFLCKNPSATSTCSIIANEERFVFDLALDLNGPAAENGRTQNLYTGLQHFGLNKSEDGGVIFLPSYKGIRVNIIKAVMVDPSNPDIQFVSAGSRGLFRSTNGGASWLSLHNNLDLEWIMDIAVKPDTFDIIYIGDRYGGLHYTTDLGSTWYSGNTGIRSADSEVVVPETLSSDGGIDQGDYDWMDPVDFQDLMDAMGESSADRATTIYVSTIGFDPSDSNKMFAGKVPGGVSYSNDGGVVWIKSNLTYPDVLDSLVDPSQPQKYLVGIMDNGVKISSDRINWENFKEGLPEGADVYALALQGDGIYLAGTYDGMFRMDRSVGDVWIDLGLDADIRDVIVDPTNSDMIWAATINGLFYGLPTGPEGAYEWTKFDVPDSNNDRFYVIEVIPGTTRDFYVGMDGGDLVRLTEDLLP
ncbi:MAG: hypothetical protein H0S79_21695, partial [Anaerolineaceae bacterium]|nr:hypothetical protein [Anaerolineaceae bacterium]